MTVTPVRTGPCPGRQSSLAFIDCDMAHLHPRNIGDGIPFARFVLTNFDSKISNMGTGFCDVMKIAKAQPNLLRIPTNLKSRYLKNRI